MEEEDGLLVNYSDSDEEGESFSRISSEETSVHNITSGKDLNNLVNSNGSGSGLIHRITHDFIGLVLGHKSEKTTRVASDNQPRLLATTMPRARWF